ncbi:hypothetical protein S40288_01655 [Stachybotrys chartarum IBT 40288]|nr:hypothetical protein S40288_01655 [Stachybotrys chartarum IBT 40288]
MHGSSAVVEHKPLKPAGGMGRAVHSEDVQHDFFIANYQNWRLTRPYPQSASRPKYLDLSPHWAQNSGLTDSSFSHMAVSIGLHLFSNTDAVLKGQYTKRILKEGRALSATMLTRDNASMFWIPDIRSAFASMPFETPFPEGDTWLDAMKNWGERDNSEWAAKRLAAEGFKDVKVTPTTPPPDGSSLSSPAVMLFLLSLLAVAATTSAAIHQDALPSYHYGAPLHVECMNRSSETGEHVENAQHEIEWIPFPVCEETGKSLEFNYGIEGEINCTIPFVSDPFFHLLEFYIHSDAPLSCRIPSRPAPHIEIVGEKLPEQEYIPLVFALAGTLQLSHMHISTHLNVLLHSIPKHHTRPHDSGVLDSGIAYSTSPLSHMEGSHTQKLVIGDPLPLSFSVRWFPTPALPKTEGKVEWQGLGGHVYASTVFYCLVSFIAGLLISGMYILGVVMPKRLKGRAMGGATPLGYGLNGGGVGNGWGYSKRID